MTKNPELEDDFEYEFATFTKYMSCFVVKILDRDKRCGYVTTTPECDQKHFVNYADLLYCKFAARDAFDDCIAYLFFGILCVLFFLTIGVVADKYFSPALTVISKTLKMNEHLAGITILAFGNSAPDLFTSLAGSELPNYELYSNVLAADIFDVALVGGMVCYLSPFRLKTHYTIRDCLFFIFGILFVEISILNDLQLSITEASLIILIYVVYIVVNVVDLILLKYTYSHLKGELLKRKTTPPKQATVNDDGKFEKMLEDIRAEASLELLVRVKHSSEPKPRISNAKRLLNSEVYRTALYDENHSVNYRLFEDFLEAINPIDMEEWLEQGIFWRMIQVLRLPLSFMLILLLPITDLEKYRHGWTKLLNCIQLIILPLITIAIYSSRFSLLSLLITVPLTIFVFKNSRTDIPPSFHLLLSIYSLGGSIYIIYSTASECVEILSVLGMITGCTNGFLGATVQAWGNSMGDLITNLAMAGCGHEQMAFAASIGGPFFNTLLSVGVLHFTLAIQENQYFIKVVHGNLGENGFVFMFIILSSVILWSMLTNFVARRSIGIFMIMVYLLYMLYAVLGEFGIIHTFEPDLLMILR